MSSETVVETNEMKVASNISQLGLTTAVMGSLYEDKLNTSNLLLSIALLLPLGACATHSYAWLAWGIALFVTLKESLAVIEYACLDNDHLMDDLRKKASKTQLINFVALLSLIGILILLKGQLPEQIIYAVEFGVIAAGCAPLFGIAGLNYVLGAAKVDTNKIATLNKYASMSGGIICALSFFMIKNPSDLKMLIALAVVSLFASLLFAKTQTPELSKEDWQQARESAQACSKPTVNMLNLLILLAFLGAAILHGAAEAAGGVDALLQQLGRG